MALIECMECGNKISHTAKICPQCGFPYMEYVAHKLAEKERSEREKHQNELKYKNELKMREEENRKANIKCQECDRVIGEVSICPYCGFDMDNYNIQVEKRKRLEEERRRAELNRRQAVNNNIPRCPTCGSTRIQKISTTKKAVGAIGFGILSTTARSQFECKSCGYKW